MACDRGGFINETRLNRAKKQGKYDIIEYQKLMKKILAKRARTEHFLKWKTAKNLARP